jgi:hypothetical protein
MASSPELSHLFVQAMENYHRLSSNEKARISQLFFQCFRYFENMFYQHRKGYLDEEVWTGWKRLMLTYYSRPGFQTWWGHRRDVYSEPFAIFLETEKLDLIPLIPRHSRESSPVFNAWLLIRSDQICDANRKVLNRKQYQCDDKILTIRKCYPHEQTAGK